MTVKSDRWIRRMALEKRMIEPFNDRQVREGVISYGLSSYGYDVRIADDFKIFTNINSTTVDPKHFDPRSFVDFKGEVCVIPPNSFALARTVEYFRIPRDVLVICLGKCVTGDTDVLDASSGRLERIDSFLSRGGSTASWRRSQVKAADISEGVAQGSLPVYEVVTRTGRRITGTPNHPLLTFGGWRTIQDLAIGDRVGVPRRIAIFGPGEMPVCEIDMLGFLISDGACRTPGGSPTYTSGDPVLRDAFAAAVTAFGCVPRLSKPMAIRATNLGHRGGVMTRNRVYAWLESLGLTVNSPDKFVPPVVFELRRSLLARFLRALFSGDGGISTTAAGGIHLEFCSTSERLARDVHHLLLRYGVVSSIRWRPGASGRGAWVLSVTGKENIRRFASEIGFVPGCAKQRRLEDVLDLIEREPQRTSNYDNLPGEAWEILRYACHSRGVSMAAMGFHASPGQGVPLPLVRELAHRFSDEYLGSLADSDILWDTVKEKRFRGFQPVFDLTLPETANFVANDMIVHNSTYARCGIIVNVTPLEPEWEGIVTLEVSNTTPLPARIYAGEGIAQMLFFQSDEPCEVSYADKKGKYQSQQGLTLPKL